MDEELLETIDTMIVNRLMNTFVPTQPPDHSEIFREWLNRLDVQATPEYDGYVRIAFADITTGHTKYFIVKVS